MEMEEEAISHPPEKLILRIKLPRAWTPDEDARLQRLAKENAFRRWGRVARQMPGRSASGCRDRWRDHLASDVYHRRFTAADDEELARLRLRFGLKWKDIGRAVYGRTSGVMKCRWRELRRSNEFLGKLWRPRAPPPSDDVESEPESESPAAVPAPQQEAYANVLASSFGSCSLSSAPTDLRAGNHALGFACTAA